MASAGANAVHMVKQVITPPRMVPVADTVSVPLRERVDGAGVLHPSDGMESTAVRMLRPRTHGSDAN